MERATEEFQFNKQPLKCPECGKQFRYFTRAAKVRCPKCGHRIHVPLEDRVKWVAQAMEFADERKAKVSFSFMDYDADDPVAQKEWESIRKKSE